MPFTAAKHVLIADDTEGAAESLAELLTLSVSEPITTAVAHNGAQAVAQAAEHRPAVVLLDLDMPVMGGIEAAAAIRAACPDGAAPLLVAVTGNAQWSVHKQARDVFDHVVCKPADIDQLAGLVDGAGGPPDNGS